jgi:hypothetical protein
MENFGVIEIVVCSDGKASLIDRIASIDIETGDGAQRAPDRQLEPRPA